MVVATLPLPISATMIRNSIKFRIISIFRCRSVVQTLPAAEGKDICGEDTALTSPARPEGDARGITDTPRPRFPPPWHGVHPHKCCSNRRTAQNPAGHWPCTHPGIFGTCFCPWVQHLWASQQSGSPLCPGSPGAGRGPHIGR